MRNYLAQNGITVDEAIAYREIIQRRTSFSRQCAKCGSTRFTYSVRKGFPVVQICILCDSILTEVI